MSRRPLTEIAIPQGVRWIVLDAVGTLIRPRESVAQVYRQLGLDHGLDLAESLIATRFSAAISQADWSVASHEGQRQAWHAIVQSVFVEAGATTLPALFEALWDRFAQPSAWRVFDDVPPALRQWEKAGYALAIASNFDHRMPGVVAGLPELQPCQQLFWSSGVGVAKPDVRFFRHIETQLKATPAELLMIGDTHEMDILGARGAGWHAEPV